MELDPYHNQNHRHQLVVKLISTPKKRANIHRSRTPGKNQVEDSRIEERSELLRGWRGESFGIRRGKELERREHVRHRQP
jgi:hypothetical protein